MVLVVGLACFRWLFDLSSDLLVLVIYRPTYLLLLLVNVKCFFSAYSLFILINCI